MMLRRLVQPENAQESIVLMFSESTILFRFGHCEKEACIVVRLSGVVTLVRFAQTEKASLAIVITPSGIA